MFVKIQTSERYWFSARVHWWTDIQLYDSHLYSNEIFPQNNEGIFREAYLE